MPARTSTRTPVRHAPRRAPAKRKPHTTPLLVRGARLLVRQPADTWGAVIAVVGVVLALAIYLDLAGPAGRALDVAAAELVGAGRFLLPPTLVLVGLRLVFGAAAGPSTRAALGIVLGIWLLIAWWHLLAGAPGLGDARPRGGVAGWLVAAPLRRLLGPVGAGVVLSAGLVAAALLAIGRPVGHLVEALRHLPRPTLRRTRVEAAPDLAIDPTADAIDDIDETDDEGHEPEPAGPIEDSGLAPNGPTGEGEEEGEPSQLVMDLGPITRAPAYKLPPAAVLRSSERLATDQAALDATGARLQATLTQFGVNAALVGITPGPTVTRFEIELGEGVKVNKVTGLGKEVEYALGVEHIRFQVPIPGRSAIGIEVPNTARQLVTLGDIIGSAEAKKARHPLECALGKDISGRPVMVNLADMPHLLIAGATGAGKSCCINSLICSVLMRNRPDQVRLILIDPKRVELGAYNGLPHLLTNVVVNPKRASEALLWAVKEMEQRYDILGEVGARDITGYNAMYDRGELAPEPGSDGGIGGEQPAGPHDRSGPRVGPGGKLRTPDSERLYSRLPFILVVVDELNDLMMVAARDVEDAIMRIAQMARAVGIHLVIATQRPSTDVITGVIKANVPSRIALSVTSQTDSRVILDTGGAEKLVGRGDMLLLSASSSRPRRIQGAYVSEGEVHKLAAHWKRQAGEVAYVDSEMFAAETAGGHADTGDDDELLAEAMELVVRSQLGSTSMLQRKLRVGFARAGRLMDLLERRGVVGPSEGSKARAVLMTVAELDHMIARGASEPEVAAVLDPGE